MPSAPDAHVGDRYPHERGSRSEDVSSWVSFPPARDCRLACPFLALLFGRIVNARLRALAADPFEKPHCENDAWRGTHILRPARCGNIPKSLGDARPQPHNKIIQDPRTQARRSAPALAAAWQQTAI